jgi:cytochrome c-type biogenesis protein CcmE
VKFASADISLPGSGNAAISLNAVGLDMSKDTTAYYTSPTAETTTESLVAASGILQVNGVTQAVVTDLSFNIDGQEQPANGVVGTNVRPDIFRGKVMVTGSLTCYFESGTIPDLFINETDIAIIGAMVNGSGAAADFVSYAMPKLNLNSSTPDDGETGLTRTYSFTAEYNSAGGSGVATEKTTFMIQDSQAA